jgi:transcriptional regulator with XRE-family HTH domain
MHNKFYERRKRLASLRRDTWMRVKDRHALKRARKNMGYTQRDLAFLVRKSQTAIYALEKGRQETLSEDFAIAIAARLGRDWENFFELEEQKPMPKLTSSQSETENVA